MSQSNVIVRQPNFRINIPLTEDMFDAVEMLEDQTSLDTTQINNLIKMHGNSALARLDKDAAIIESFRNERGETDQYQICLWGDAHNPTPDRMMAVFCKIIQTTESVPAKSGLWGKTAMVETPVITTLPVLAVCGKEASTMLIYQMDCCGTNSAVISINMGDDFISFNRDPVSGIMNEHHHVFENKVRRANTDDIAMFTRYIQNGFQAMREPRATYSMVVPEA